MEALNISGCGDVVEAASFFLGKGVGLVVVTRGGSGALAVSKRRSGGGGGGDGGGGGGSEKDGDGGAEESGGSGGGGSSSCGGGLHTWEQKCAPVEVRVYISGYVPRAMVKQRGMWEMHGRTRGLERGCPSESHAEIISRLKIRLSTQVPVCTRFICIVVFARANEFRHV